jgi:hypothetical protein
MSFEDKDFFLIKYSYQCFSLTVCTLCIWYDGEELLLLKPASDSPYMTELQSRAFSAFILSSLGMPNFAFCL